MFDSVLLDVAIGILFVFVLMSVLCTTVRESIEGVLRMRGQYLQKGLQELMQNDDVLIERLYKHPLLSGLYKGPYGSKAKLPSYIPAKSFALALIDVATPKTEGQPADLSMAGLRESVAKVANEPVKRVLEMALESSADDVAKVQQFVEGWFNSGMDRVSGWYKRASQWIVFGIALTLAVGLNVDTIRIADELYRNEALRQALVTRASQSPNVATSAETEKALNELRNQKLPIGWRYSEAIKPSTPTDPRAPETDPWWTSIPGWLITAFAASLGAPFWFDLLQKVMNIRAALKPKPDPVKP